MKMPLTIFLMGICAFNSAHALPTIYPTSISLLSSINNKTNSNIVADNVDPRVFYVMPPNSAQSTVSGLHTVNANVGFCKEIADQQRYSRTLAEKLMIIEAEQAERKDFIEDLNTKLSNANAEMARKAVVLKVEEIIALDARIESIEARISELNDKLLSCTENCQHLSGEIKELRNEKMETSRRRRELAAARTKEVREYEKSKALVEAIKSDIATEDDTWTKINSRVLTLRNSYLNMYSAFASMEGGRANIQFKSNWDDNIDSLRAENPSFTFHKMETRNAVISTNISDLKDAPPGGAILGYSIGGLYSEGKFTQTAYPQDLSANVRLSLLGACPMLHPEYYDIPNSSEMKYGMSITYEYPSAFTVDVEANYNMYKMYQKIVKSGSKGGFFRSKSWSSVEERTFFRDEFKVKWNEQDESVALTDVQKADMEREMRNNILGRLAAIGLPAMTNAAALLPTPAIPTTGAVVLSGSLMKTCPTNIYCVGASIGLNVLQAIFGSSSTSSSYTNIQDADLKEIWSKTKVTYKPAISTYN